ncbi:PIN domain-containing protein [Bacillus velezensis]|uniref:PIN domain-containing protein n=1 Tax=Bacillus velezensis TaxID=492670 RepID=UPI002FBDE730
MNIFLDTQVYQAKNFNYNDEHIKRLVDLIDKDIVNLYITTITKNEIENHIKEKVSASRQSINSFKKHASILKNFDLYKPIWDRELIKIAETEILENFNRFLTKNKVQEIKVSGKYTSDIFEKYFNGEAPFSAKKKDEFPDAFALYSIVDWAENSKELMYIVSGDNDLKNYCEDSEFLFHIESLEKALDYINQNDEVRYEFAQRLYDDQQYEFLDYINEAISDKVVELDIDVNDLVEDVEIKYLNVNSVDDLAADPLVLELNENKLTIVFNIVIDMHITVSSVDPTRSPYDSEEKEYLFVEYMEEEYEDIIRVPVELKLDIEDYQNQRYTIESVLLNNGNTFYYSIV